MFSLKKIGMTDVKLIDTRCNIRLKVTRFFNVSHMPLKNINVSTLLYLIKKMSCLTIILSLKSCNSNELESSLKDIQYLFKKKKN